jgi:hypothetical protein
MDIVDLGVIVGVWRMIGSKIVFSRKWRMEATIDFGQMCGVVRSLCGWLSLALFFVESISRDN